MDEHPDSTPLLVPGIDGVAWNTKTTLLGPGPVTTFLKFLFKAPLLTESATDASPKIRFMMWNRFVYSLKSLPDTKLLSAVPNGRSFTAIVILVSKSAKDWQNIQAWPAAELLVGLLSMTPLNLTFQGDLLKGLNLEAPMDLVHYIVGEQSLRKTQNDLKQLQNLWIHLTDEQSATRLRGNGLIAQQYAVNSDYGHFDIDRVTQAFEAYLKQPRRFITLVQDIHRRETSSILGRHSSLTREDRILINPVGAFACFDEIIPQQVNVYEQWSERHMNRAISGGPQSMFDAIETHLRLGETAAAGQQIWKEVMDYSAAVAQNLSEDQLRTMDVPLRIGDFTEIHIPKVQTEPYDKDDKHNIMDIIHLYFDSDRTTTRPDSSTRVNCRNVYNLTREMISEVQKIVEDLRYRCKEVFWAVDHLDPNRIFIFAVWESGVRRRLVDRVVESWETNRAERSPESSLQTFEIYGTMPCSEIQWSGCQETEGSGCKMEMFDFCVPKSHQAQFWHFHTRYIHAVEYHAAKHPWLRQMLHLAHTNPLLDSKWNQPGRFISLWKWDCTANRAVVMLQHRQAMQQAYNGFGYVASGMKFWTDDIKTRDLHMYHVNDLERLLSSLDG